MQLDNINYKNLYYLLLYAYQNLKEANLAWVETQEYESIHDLFAGVFVHGITAQVKRGFHREYVKHEGVFPTALGQVNVAETIKQQTLITGKLVCSYEDFLSNSLPNQALKSVILLLIKQGKIKEKNRESLRKLLLYFSDTKIISPNSIQWSMIKTHRANSIYRMLLGVCRLIVDGLVYSDENGLLRLKDIFETGELLSQVFEKAILAYYTKHYLYCYPKKVNMMLADGFCFDICMQRENRFLLLDTKYYEKEVLAEKVRTTRIKTRDQSQVIIAILLYPKTLQNEDIDGVNVSVKTLDLNQEWKYVKGNLNRLIEGLM